MVRDYQTIEELLPQAGTSIYRLVRMAVNRALEISDGQPSLVKTPGSDKEASLALQEILEKRILFKDVADAADKKPAKK
jgi:DNA-directed RNA polymerase omega subunit